jgi:GNAT superfamily N-acetyltransferase
MSQILDTLSASEIAQSIESNMFEAVKLRGLWAGAEIHDEPGLLWCITDVPIPLLNVVLRAQLSAEQIEPAIQAALARSAARKVPFIWGTGPSTRPTDLAERLAAHGFIHGGDMPGMAMDLQKINEPTKPPTGLTIKRVDRENDIRTCCQIVFARTGGMPLPIANAFADLYASVGNGTSSTSIRYYLGFLNGEAVAAANLVLAAGVAGIYNVATVPEAQRKGIGSAITLAPLHEARALGYRIGVLGSSEMGYKVYLRLGFREYCKFGLYIWTGAR